MGRVRLLPGLRAFGGNNPINFILFRKKGIYGKFRHYLKYHKDPNLTTTQIFKTAIYLG